MKKPLICTRNDFSDAYLSRFFTWLTRIGAAPKFGSTTVVSYQLCQCATLRWLENSKGAGFPLRCKAGMIQYKPTVGNWQDLVTVYYLSGNPILDKL